MSIVLEPPPKKLLIVLHGAIGDVARALPVAVRIKRHWPETEIHWAVEPLSRSLLEKHPAIDKIIVFDRPRGLPAFWEFIKLLRAERYELVLDLQRHFKSGVVSRSTGAAIRLGFNRKGSREGNWLLNNHHILPCSYLSTKIQHFEFFCDYLGLPKVEPLEFGLRVDDTEQAHARALLRCEEESCASVKRVAFLIGSTWESRKWPLENYAVLATKLYQSLGVRSYIIGSNSERDEGERIVADATPGAVVNLCGLTSLRGVVAVLFEVDAAVGGDSGPMHIAAAVGLQTISLWGSTSYQRSAPYGQERYILDSGIGCSPCYLRDCPGLNRACMREISPDVVFSKLVRLLKESSVGY